MTVEDTYLYFSTTTCCVQFRFAVVCGVSYWYCWMDWRCDPEQHPPNE